MFEQWFKWQTKNIIEKKNHSRDVIEKNEFERIDWDAIDSLQNDLSYIKDKINYLETLMEKIIDNQTMYKKLYDTLVERDIRELNYNIRGYSSKKLPATHFVTQKNGIL